MSRKKVVHGPVMMTQGQLRVAMSKVKNKKYGFVDPSWDVEQVALCDREWFDKRVAVKVYKVILTYYTES